MKVILSAFLAAMLALAPVAGHAAASAISNGPEPEITASNAETPETESDLSIGSLIAALVLVALGVRIYAPVFRRYGKSWTEHGRDVQF